MALKLKEKTFRRVPKNSVLSIKTIVVTGSTYFLNGRLDRGSTNKKRWTHKQLKNKTVKYTLSQSGVSLARIHASFTGTSNSTVKVEASIKKPDGTQHGSTWSASLFGKKGDTARAKIRVRVS